DTTYADSVKSEILNQIGQAGTDFSNRNKWCPYNNGSGVFSADSMEITPWIMRFVLAYDYLNAGGYTGFTAQNKTAIETWLHNAALLWDQVMVDTINWTLAILNRQEGGMSFKIAELFQSSCYRRRTCHATPARSDHTDIGTLCATLFAPG